MNRGLLWITMAVLGAASTLLTSLGLLTALLFLLLTAPLILRGDRTVALSGVLTGFGGLWLFLMARQASTGGHIDNETSWIAVGLVPLVIGLALLVAIVIRRAMPTRSPER